MSVRLIVVFAVAVLVGIVIMQNTAVVSFQFLFWHMSMSQILLLLVTLVLGFVLGFVTAKLLRRSRNPVDASSRRHLDASSRNHLDASQ